ncbi:MAG: M50 family metallopeptidase [Promethearchaeota archaeon]
MKIAKIKGIEIKLHASTLLIIALIGFYAASFYAAIIPRASIIELIVVGLINGSVILISILLHELSHSVVAQKYGLNVSEIELYLFGGVSKIEEEPKTPKSELIIAVVGPLSSLIIGAVLLFMFFLPVSIPAFLLVTLFYSGISNIGLGIFNLLPAFPIDGGRVLRAILWKRRNDILSATKTASKVGVVFGYGLMIYGLLQLFTTGFINGIWLIIMGSFLKSTARQSYSQTLSEVTLSNLSVREILSLPTRGIPFDKTLTEALRDYFFPYKKPYFPVIQSDEIVGIIHMSDIRKIPISQRSSIIVGYVMKKISEFQNIDEDQSGKEAWKRLKKLTKRPHLIVVREKINSKLVGFIGEEDVLSSLKYWSFSNQNS